MLKLHSEVRLVRWQPGATQNEIDDLRKRFPALPEDVAVILAEATELEIGYRNRYLRLYGPIGCMEIDEAYRISEQIPGAITLGDNGGGEAIVYHPKLGLCRVAYGSLDENTMVKIAESITDLLINAAAPPEEVGGVEVR